MNEEEKPPQLPMRVFPEPALIWECPAPTCRVKSAAPGMPLIKRLMMGRRLQMTCNRCGQRVELMAPEAPRIIVPGAADNRAERRKVEAIGRKGGGNGA